MRTITLFCFLALLASCSSSRFVEYQNSNEIIGKGGNVQLVDLAAFSTQEVHTYCLSLPKLTDVGLGQLIHCTKTLLGRNNLSSNLRNYAISNYNYAIYHLLKNGNDGASSEGRVTLIHSNLNHFIFSEEMLAKDPSLQPKIFGELGIPVVFSRDNQQVGLDRYAPLEGVMKDATLIVSDIKIRKQRFEVMLDLQFYSNHSNLMIGTNQYLLRHSPGAAYLALIEKADIDDYNWLGFVSPKQAEKRRGVFAIGGIFKDKIPLIMIHGLNSDPLIWRHLTMAILNEPSLMSRYQIWHIYYPSGPPPFYTASKTRDNLHSLLTEIGSNNLKEEAVIIGHSMGGVIAKLLAVKTDFSLWNTAFNQSPEHLLTENDVSLKNIFIFDPVFNFNTVFFLDTPFKGSAVANSTIGYIGALLVALPGEFTQLFQSLIKRAGPEVITKAMQPFLLDYGPNSVQVLRPGHPLMGTLYDLPIAGKAYAIVGSNGELSCDTSLTCSAITDGVVSYDSANYRYAKEFIIAPSSHNSFQSRKAIEFIIAKLKNNSI